MTQSTCKLQLLAFAMLISVFSIGSSFLLLRLNGCWWGRMDMVQEHTSHSLVQVVLPVPKSLYSKNYIGLLTAQQLVNESLNVSIQTPVRSIKKDVMELGDSSALPDLDRPHILYNTSPQAQRSITIYKAQSSVDYKTDGHEMQDNKMVNDNYYKSQEVISISDVKDNIISDGYETQNSASHEQQKTINHETLDTVSPETQDTQSVNAQFGEAIEREELFFSKQKFDSSPSPKKKRKGSYKKLRQLRQLARVNQTNQHTSKALDFVGLETADIENQNISAAVIIETHHFSPRNERLEPTQMTKSSHKKFKGQRQQLDAVNQPTSPKNVTKKSQKYSYSQSDVNSLKWVPQTNITAPSTKAFCRTKEQCVELLSKEEQKVFESCERRSTEWMSLQGKIIKCQCKFLNGTGRPRVALVSLPGSGNTWLRGLLEHATGVCTGSIYCDKTLFAGGMCGEGVRGGSVLAVKTHTTKLKWTGQHYSNETWLDRTPFFDGAIFLVRNPSRVLIAEWNRRNAYKFSSEQDGSNHIRYLQKPEYFLENSEWKKFVPEHLRKWKMMLLQTLLQSKGHAVLLVHYEDLQTDSAGEVLRTLQFLHFPHSPVAVRHKLKAGFTTFYRNHTDTFQHFTPDQQSLVQSTVEAAVHVLDSHGWPEVAKRIHEYIVFDKFV